MAVVIQPVNQLVLEWQNALPLFGISYSGPKDGRMNQFFTDAIISLEGKYKAYGQIFTGNGIKMSVSDAKKKFLSDTLDDNSKKDLLVKPETAQDQSLKLWKSFLSESLPVVGRVYDGDLAVAAKKIENVISKSIDKPVAGLIWNDVKKQFNTTPDDVRKALELVQTHAKNTALKPAEFTLDQRVIRMSEILLEKK